MEFLQQNWHWAALAAVSGGWLAVDFILNRNRKDLLSPVEATLLMNREDAIVIDVREPGEFGGGHIPNARNIPAGEIDSRIREIDKFKNRALLLCCQSGSRSNSALTKLKQAGFEKLYSLRGGMLEWERAGQPVSKKKK